MDLLDILVCSLYTFGDREDVIERVGPACLDFDAVTLIKLPLDKKLLEGVQRLIELFKLLTGLLIVVLPAAQLMGECLVAVFCDSCSLDNILPSNK